MPFVDLSRRYLGLFADLSRRDLGLFADLSRRDLGLFVDLSRPFFCGAMEILISLYCLIRCDVQPEQDQTRPQARRERPLRGLKFEA